MACSSLIACVALRVCNEHARSNCECVVDYFLTNPSERFIYVPRAAHSRAARSKFQSCRYVPVIQPTRITCRWQPGSRARTSARWIAAWVAIGIRDFPAVFRASCPKPRREHVGGTESSFIRTTQRPPRETRRPSSFCSLQPREIRSRTVCSRTKCIEYRV
jgi:hypothetical protein